MKKKILFIHHCSNIGGAGISGLKALNSIDRDIYDIVVYCNSSGNHNHMIGLFRDNGYKVLDGGNSPVIFSHCVGGEKFIFSTSSITNYIKILKDHKKIRSLIRDVNPDIVILNSMTLFWIGRLAKQNNSSTICFFRETYVKGLFGLRTAFIKRQLGKYIDQIAFISDYERIKSCGVKSRKMTIYNAIDEKNFSQYDRYWCRERFNMAQDFFNLLYVGGMSRLKGALTIIKAMNLLRDINIKLIFVGYRWNGKRKRLSHCKSFKGKLKYLLNMDYERRCIDYIVRNGLQKNIVFYDYQMNIAPFYIACDALVFPMTKPHQARPLFEAGYCKTPVIITEFPNIKEFADESSCYLFENKNHYDLAEAVLNVFNNPDDGMKRAELNYKRTVARHNEHKFQLKIRRLLCGESN